MNKIFDNPLSIDFDESTDLQLIEESLSGSAGSLEALVKRHQGYIYNIALRMVLSPFDAEDITQEVLIKLVTKLSQFSGKSSFRTWLYRITFNHVLQMKRYWLEKEITSFDEYANQLDGIKNISLQQEEENELKDLIEESKLACIHGMLLCLDREQRLVYILGEIFSVDHNLGAQMLEISKDNFRQRLSRARKDLYQFMNQKCGLVNTNNPCRCAKKTKGFIEAGWVDPHKMKFNIAYYQRINDIAPQKSKDLDDLLESDYIAVFKRTPFQEKQHAEKLMQILLNEKNIKEIFKLT